MIHRAGAGGLSTVTVRQSACASALDELQMYDWWRHALAEAGGNATDACVAVLRERSEDPLMVFAACELERLR